MVSGLQPLVYDEIQSPDSRLLITLTESIRANFQNSEPIGDEQVPFDISALAVGFQQVEP